MDKKLKKRLILTAPYLLFVYLFGKVAQALRLAPGTDASQKLLHLGDGFSTAFSNALPSFNPIDLLIGLAGAVIVWIAVYVRGKNAKKFRKNMEYGSARWGTADDIAPYIDPNFQNNILLTQTERLTMSSRPKDPKTARNKNVLVIGGSGSGKTRFFIKPNIMQLHLLFYFIYKFFKSTTAQVLILTLCLILYSVISHFCGLATTWYESVFCVVLGMIFSLEKEQIDAVLNKKALLITLCSVVLFSICFVGYRVFPLGIIFKIASSLFFAIVTISLAFLLQNTSVVCNKFTTILGAFSLEIYVSQGFMIALRKGANFHIDNSYIFVLCAIIGTFAISYVMKKIYDQVVGLTLKLVNKTS